jgi:hypothetical protein
MNFKTFLEFKRVKSLAGIELHIFVLPETLSMALRTASDNNGI